MLSAKLEPSTRKSASACAKRGLHPRRLRGEIREPLLQRHAQRRALRLELVQDRLRIGVAGKEDGDGAPGISSSRREEAGG